MPGATLFPATKMKEIMLPRPKATQPTAETDECEGTERGASEKADYDSLPAAEESAAETQISKGASSSAEVSDLLDLDGGNATAPATGVPAMTGTDASPEENESKKHAIDEKQTEPEMVPQLVPVHRFLVVTKERFLVLDSDGNGVGSEATVKSNHHLTELLKMTFRKKDPELITIWLLNNNADGSAAEPKTRQYRVSKRQLFVETLQKNMQRFK